MKRHLPIQAVVGFCVFFVPALVLCQPQRVTSGAAPSIEEKAAGNINAYLPAGVELQPKLLKLMHLSEVRCLEGSELIRSGDSAKARIAFDAAVDTLLQGEWDLTSTPVLDSYFQDLILRIQRDESRYLRADEAEEKPERAVVDDLSTLDLIPIKVDPALTDALEADILNSKYDIPVTFNESVRKSLSFWLNEGRRFFIDGLVRSGRYKDMIERIFKEESVPRDVMYLAQVESLFKPNALSRALCKGIWQFGRGTAIRYGLKVDRYVDERSDPEKSTRAAARYLTDLYAMFNDWNLVLAAYNWGEGAVQQLVDKTKINDFWQLAARNRGMPNETKNHVPLIMASIILARNPEKFGLPTELEPPLLFERVTLTKQINIKSLAKTLNVPVDLLVKLNPALRTNYTPPGSNFELCIPPGMGADLLEKIAVLPSADLRGDPDFNGRHKVQPGETLSAIAARYRVSVEDLQAANNLKSPQMLRADTWLVVPTTSPDKPAAATRPASNASFSGNYQVKPGETLGSIAERFAVSVDSLQKANRISSPQDLRAGAWIKVPSNKTLSQPKAAPAPNQAKAVPLQVKSQVRRYQIKGGDTLSSIAAAFGVTATEIQTLNAIKSPRSLQVGSWLQIPPAPPERLASIKKN
jgi:membrane-bound lytic murein transglycosylase D